MKTPGSKRRRRIRTPRNPRRYGLAGVIAAAMLFAAAMIVAVSGGHERVATGLADSLASPVIFDGFPELLSVDSPLASPRPVYRHSVIPGGAYTPEELKDALVHDAVAAAHYRDIKPDAVRAEVVQQDRFAYVSYRKDNQVYWTRNKVRLSAGETILTDGTQEIRARCGNCISETAKFPVAETEPDLAELDRLVDDNQLDNSGDPFLAAAIRSTLDSPGSNARGLGGPGALAGGPAVGSSSSNPTGGGPGVLTGGSPGGGIGPTRFTGSPGSPSGGSPGSPFGGGPTGPPGSVGGQPEGPEGPPSGFDDPRPGDPSGDNPPGGSGPSPGSPTTGGPFPDSPFVPPGTGPWIPPGIDLPPGFDPDDPPPGFNPLPGGGVNPPPGGDPGTPGSELDPPGPDPNTREPGSSPEPASIPEPATVILVGGGVAAALLRKLRRRS